MPIWETLGMQAAGQAASAGMGLFLQRQNDQRQLNMERKLQRMQMDGTKEMTDYNMSKQLQMWKDTSYPAQMQMLKQAGLNPGLIYGMGGGGGQTPGATQGAGANIGSAPKGGQEIAAMMQMAIERQMAHAQIENLKAQTEKTKAETTAVQPGIELTKQQTLNLQTQNAINELERAFQADTLQNRESIINISLSKLIEETRIMENNREISDETKATQIKLMFQELKNKITEGLNMEKTGAKTDKEAAMIDTQIAAINQAIDINALDQEMAKDGFNPKTGTAFKTVYNIFQWLKRLF